MRKSIVTMLATLGVAGMLASAAFAHDPAVSITSPTDGASIVLETTEFPYTLPVAGTVSHNPGVVKLEVFVNGVSAYDDQWNNVTNQPWSFDHTVTAPGAYGIKAVAEHGQNTVEDSVEITVEEDVTTVIVDYPAAPSVANKLLKAAGVDARYGKGKDGGNYIADVADHMGPGATFSGVEKHDVEAYEAAVRTFLVEAGALS